MNRLYITLALSCLAVTQTSITFSAQQAQHDEQSQLSQIGDLATARAADLIEKIEAALPTFATSVFVKVLPAPYDIALVTADYVTLIVNLKTGSITRKYHSDLQRRQAPRAIGQDNFEAPLGLPRLARESSSNSFFPGGSFGIGGFVFPPVRLERQNAGSIVAVDFSGANLSGANFADADIAYA